jgi:predicted transcriptional regulator
MSLTDLKKSKDSKTKKKNFTIDEFISDAEDYAKGAPKIVSELTNDEKSSHKLNLKQAISEAKRYVEMTEIEHQQIAQVRAGVAARVEKPFRRATFTLSEEAIGQLQDLSEGSDLAKSHILRILIDELCNKEQNEQLKKLLQSRIG